MPKKKAFKLIILVYNSNVSQVLVRSGQGNNVTRGIEVDLDLSDSPLGVLAKVVKTRKLGEIVSTWDIITLKHGEETAYVMATRVDLESPTETVKDLKEGWRWVSVADAGQHSGNISWWIPMGRERVWESFASPIITFKSSVL